MGMENWLSKISCLACWEWWEVALAIASGGIGWFLRKITSDRKLDAILDKHIIDDLELIAEYMDWWADNQRPDGKIDFIEKGRKDVEKLLNIQTLMGKYSDWILTEGMPEEKRAMIIRSDALDSIDAIRRCGHREAKKIRKKELEGSDKKPLPWVNS